MAGSMFKEAAAHLPIERLGRVAIVHDWFQGYHGAERVVDAMRQAMVAGGHAPDIFTFQAARELLPPELAAAIVRESRLARLPGLRQKAHNPGRWRYLLPYMHTYFGRLDLDEYDVVISSSHANAAHVRTRPDALHLCYCHTPMRYAWLSETERSRRSGLTGLGLRIMSGWLRRVDLQGSRRPDVYVANSEAVRGRIQRFYGRDAYVVHPPVDVGRFNPSGGKEEGHFLWVHRLVGYKHPELVAEAFRGLPYRLTMIGVGPLEQRLRAILPPNVQLRGWTSELDLVRLFERAIGFIHVGEEDFGISMVEALAAGTPVIGFAGGGARDIVRANLDGVLIDRHDLRQLREAVHHIAHSRWDPSALAARAGDFSVHTFVERFGAVLDDHLPPAR